MDDVYQILIYLFIIFFFLSSIFKKRKKQSPQAGKESQVPQSVSETENLTYQQTANEADDYDILKEVEKMFQMDSTTEKETGPLPDPWEKQKPAPQAEKKITWDRPTASEHLRTASELKFETEWQKRSLKLKKEKELVDRQYQKKASEFEELLKSREVVQNIRINRLKERIMNSASLREYILVSEILGKPKAFS
jgi:hypothetical protein